MPASNVDIEWIIREVVRRLRELESPKPKVATNGANASTSGRPGTIELDEPVITLATLDKRLDGISRLVVPPRAIVTPAVVDELKDRRVDLIREVRPAENARSARPRRTSGNVVIVLDGVVDQQALARQIPAARIIGESSLASSLRIAGDGSKQRQKSVLLTPAPSSAVVEANRNPDIRAAVGFNFPAVRQAVDEAGANLLAVDPAGKSVSQLTALINEFFRPHVVD